MEILNKSEHRAIGGGGGLKIGKNRLANVIYGWPLIEYLAGFQNNRIITQHYMM